MKNPCFDPATKIDCPDRAPGCSVKCPKWAKYKKEKNKEYEERRKQSEYNSMLIDPRKQHRIDRYNRRKNER